MKRFLMAILILVAFAGQAFAASSVVWTCKRVPMPGNKEWIEVQAVFTCHTDGTFTTTALYENEVAEAAGTVLNLKGFYLMHVAYYYGATGATDNSDLTVLEHTSTGKDNLHRAGENIIDNATNNDFKPYIGGAPSVMPIYGPLYMAIANNSVNGATGTIIFRFIR